MRLSVYAGDPASQVPLDDIPRKLGDFYLHIFCDEGYSLAYLLKFQEAINVQWFTASIGGNLRPIA